MKKFAKMLALGLALAMTLGMTVCAAENQSVTTPDPSEGVGVWVPKDFGFSPNVSITEDMVDDMETTIGDAGKEIVSFVTKFSLTPPKNWDGKPIVVGFEKSDLPALSAGEGFVLYHFKDGKYVEGIAVNWNDETKLYEAEITNFSDFVLMLVKDNGTITHTPDPGNYGGEWLHLPANATAAAGTAAPVSPKTGETLPVAGMMAVLCLAGALVCAKKARCNG